MRILAVDDDEFILEILSEAVKAIGGHELELASSGENAIEAIEQAKVPFDCFMLDIQMPGMTGIELCKLIRSTDLYNKSPIFMITAMSDKSYVDDSFDAGATDYITKPFDFQELFARISFVQELLEIPNSRQRENSLDGIISQVMDESTYDLIDVVPIPDIARALDLHAFENYVQQLSKAQYYSSSIFAIGVETIDTVFMRSSGREFEDHILDIADTISRCICPIPGFFTYTGSGVFCCIIERRKTPALSELHYYLDIETTKQEMVYRNGQPVEVGYYIGKPVTPSLLERSKVTDLLRKSINLAGADRSGMQNVVNRISWA